MRKNNTASRSHRASINVVPGLMESVVEGG